MVSAGVVCSALLFSLFWNAYHDSKPLSYSEFETFLKAENHTSHLIESVTIETGNPLIQVKFKGQAARMLTVPSESRERMVTILHEKNIPINLLCR